LVVSFGYYEVMSYGCVIDDARNILLRSRTLNNYLCVISKDYEVVFSIGFTFYHNVKTYIRINN